MIERERMERLLAFLPTLPQERFNIREWGHIDAHGVFTGCVAGWASQIFVTDGYESQLAGAGFDGDMPVTLVEPSSGKQGNLKAFADFFGLNLRQSFYICGVPSYNYAGTVTPVQAASHVRDVLTGKVE